MRNLSKKDISPILKLYKKGMSMNLIEKELNLGKGVVSYRLKSIGYEIRPRKHYSQGEKNIFWKGGRIFDKGGYELVYSPNHPHKNHQNKMRVHRLVMEKKLGRYLKPTEVVDHIDGNPANNHISNLRVFSSNAEHLKVTLKGKCPKWTKEGRDRTLEGVEKYQKKLSKMKALKNYKEIRELLCNQKLSKNDVLRLRLLRRRLKTSRAKDWLSDKQWEEVLMQ